jgi:hypothetical protein
MADGKKVRDLPARKIDGSSVKGGRKAAKKTARKSTSSSAKFAARKRVKLAD